MADHHMPESPFFTSLDGIVRTEEGCRGVHQYFTFVFGGDLSFLDEVFIGLLGLPFLVDVEGDGRSSSLGVF